MEATSCRCDAAARTVLGSASERRTVGAVVARAPTESAPLCATPIEAESDRRPLLAAGPVRESFVVVPDRELLPRAVPISVADAAGADREAGAPERPAAAAGCAAGWPAGAGWPPHAEWPAGAGIWCGRTGPSACRRIGASTDCWYGLPYLPVRMATGSSDSCRLATGSTTEPACAVPGTIARSTRPSRPGVRRRAGAVARAAGRVADRAASDASVAASPVTGRRAAAAEATSPEAFRRTGVTVCAAGLPGAEAESAAAGRDVPAGGATLRRSGPVAGMSSAAGRPIATAEGDEPDRPAPERPGVAPVRPGAGPVAGDAAPAGPVAPPCGARAVQDGRTDAPGRTAGRSCSEPDSSEGS